MFCPNCGTKNLENAEFCENCGSKLSNSGTPPSSPTEPVVDTNPSMIIIVLGYIFAISGLIFGLLGGLVGVVIGIYLFTRKNPRAKYQGRIIFS